MSVSGVCVLYMWVFKCVSEVTLYLLVQLSSVKPASVLGHITRIFMQPLSPEPHR